MRNTLITIIVIALLILIGWGIKNRNNSSSTATTTPTATQQEAAANLPNLGTLATANDIVITAPVSGDTLHSPVAVSGKARGTWFFEASAPVAIIDLNGTILGRGNITAQGEWMTTDFVPFTGSISFATTTGSTAGAVVFFNDNPSGQASTSKYIAVPIVFTR